jgi:hypothetical protein
VIPDDRALGPLCTEQILVKRAVELNGSGRRTG